DMGQPVITVERANVLAYEDTDIDTGWCFNPPDDMKRIRELARYVMRHQPEIIAMQAMWHRHLWEAFLHDLEILGDPDPLDESYAIHFSDVGGEDAENPDLAILSQYPLSDPKFDAYNEQVFNRDACGALIARSKFQRGVGRVTATIDGRQVLVAT